MEIDNGKIERTDAPMMLSLDLLDKFIDECEFREESSEKRVLLTLAKKEQEILKKLKAHEFDMTGTVDDVRRRLDSSAVIIVDPTDYQHMKIKAAGFDMVSAIANNTAESANKKGGK